MARDKIMSYLEDLDDEVRAQKCAEDERIFLRSDCHPTLGLLPVYHQELGALVFLCPCCRREWGPRVVIARDPKRAN